MAVKRESLEQGGQGRIMQQTIHLAGSAGIVFAIRLLEDVQLIQLYEINDR